MAKTKNAPRSGAGDTTAARQRALQRVIDKKDQAKTGGRTEESKAAVQAGVRPQPSRMPAQHLAKPGRESDLALAPRFEAPGYRGSGKLEGMKAIVTGADSGIGRAVAVLFARGGC